MEALSKLLLLLMLVVKMMRLLYRSEAVSRMCSLNLVRER